MSLYFNYFKKISELDEIYVYCSNEKIKAYIPEGIKYLKRDVLLDQDSTKMNEVLKCFSDEWMQIFIL